MMVGGKRSCVGGNTIIKEGGVKAGHYPTPNKVNIGGLMAIGQLGDFISALLHRYVAGTFISYIQFLLIQNAII